MNYYYKEEPQIFANDRMAQNTMMPPNIAPPDFIPERGQGSMLRSVDSQSMRNCIGKFTYVWLENGSEFWIYPIQLGRHSVSGFRFHRPFGWTFFGVSLNKIDYFMCF